MIFVATKKMESFYESIKNNNQKRMHSNEKRILLEFSVNLS